MVPVQMSLQPTNGISYLKVFLNISTLPASLKSYIPLFCSVITNVGAGTFDYKEMDERKMRFLRGMSSSPCIIPHHTIPDKYYEGILFKSYCLNENFDDTISIWSDIFLDPKLDDHNRIKTLLLELLDNLASSVSDNAHNYAITRSSSFLSSYGQMKERYFGLSQVDFIKYLSSNCNMEDISQSLRSIASSVIDQTNMRYAINTTEDYEETAIQNITTFIDSIPSLTSTVVDEIPHPFNAKPTKQFIQMPFNVNYVAQSLKAVPYTHEDYSKLAVLSKILSLKYLHNLVREKGGAYGSGLQLSDCNLSFFSYRDPNLLETLNTFNESNEWIMSNSFSDQDLEEAKVSIIGRLDHPVEPGSRGQTMFLNRRTPQMRQKFRDQLFAVSRNDVLECSNKYLYNSSKSIVIIGSDSEKIKDDPTWEIQNSQTT